ncbi:MAG: GHKL domain-containing protein [Ruminococcus sp.]|nr:GHKL domain-containing protein [Ruminococcus sp.]
MQFTLDCITTILIALLCFLMLFNKYEIKHDKLWLKILGIGSIIAAKMGCILLHIGPLNLFTSWIMCLAITFFFYNCRLRTALIYSFVYIMIVLVTDAFGVLFVSTFYNNTITETLGASDLVWHHHIWNWIMQLFLSRITALAIRKKDNINARWYEFIFYIFLLLFEVIFFASVSSAVQDYMSGNFLIWVMFGFMILDICVMVLLHRISIARESEQKVSLMQQQETLQLQMYQELQKKYNETREISHDINRHIVSLKTLIDNSSNKQAEKYLSELTEESNRLHPVIKNQNSMLEIILNTTFAKCNKNNIELKLNIEDFPMKFISDMDMTTIFSNLLDNAIDACMEISKSQRKIRVIIRAQMGLIVIKITNSCKEANLTQMYFGKTTKENHSGIGLSNVRKAVEKYEGIMSVKQRENLFCVSITFVNQT